MKNHDENALNTFFDTMAATLLGSLLDAHDSEQNAPLRAWLDAGFQLDPGTLLRHAEMICQHFNAGDDGYLLMHGIDDQLTTMTFSRKERTNPMNKGMVGYAAPRDLDKVNALLKVIISWYECELLKARMDKGDINE